MVIAWGTCDRGNVDGTSTHSRTCIAVKKSFENKCRRVFIDTRISRVFELIGPSFVLWLFQKASQNQSLGFVKEWVFERNQKITKASNEPLAFHERTYG
jgi:hypothetical protein